MVAQKGMMVHKAPYERYYGDTTREKAQAAIDLTQPMANSAMTTPTSYAGWRDYGIPVTYIKCTKDVAVPGELCDMYISRMKDAGVDVTVEEMDSGHSPFWIQPQNLLEVLKRAVE